MCRITKREREKAKKINKLNLNIKMTRGDANESAKKTNHEKKTPQQKTRTKKLKREKDKARSNAIIKVNIKRKHEV